jgi:hypothetical protein
MDNHTSYRVIGLQDKHVSLIRDHLMKGAEDIEGLLRIIGPLLLPETREIYVQRAVVFRSVAESFEPKG